MANKDNEHHHHHHHHHLHHRLRHVIDSVESTIQDLRTSLHHAGEQAGSAFKFATQVTLHPLDAMVMLHEGFAPRAYSLTYHSTHGTVHENWTTIGAGLTGTGKTQITPEQGLDLLHKELATKRQFASERFGMDANGKPYIDSLRPHEQDALMDMVFNMRETSITNNLVERVQALAKYHGSEAERVKLVDNLANKMLEFDRDKPSVHTRRVADVTLLKGDFQGFENYLQQRGKTIGIINEHGNVTHRNLENATLPDFTNCYSQTAKTPAELKTAISSAHNKRSVT